VNRIANLPRRDWSQDANEIALRMSDLLRAPGGTETLLPIQGVGLLELSELEGLICFAEVGGGKTHTAALAPTVLGADKPILFIPGELREPTHVHHARIRRHWRMPAHYRVESYECLALERHRDLLDRYRPDLIVCDEAHKLKRLRKSSAARRIRRYLEKHPECRFVALSGTPSEHGIKDYLHLLLWSLRDLAPVPADYDEQDSWSQCLDPGVDYRPDLAILEPALGPCRDYSHAGSLFRARVEQTPGIVISQESWGEPGSLRIRGIRIDTPQSLEGVWENLRRLWVRPDGEPVMPGPDGGRNAGALVYTVAREMADGFFYYPDPGPPDLWRARRRAWCAFVRTIIESGDHFDTPAEIGLACSRGILDPSVWRDWTEIRDDYDPDAHRKAAWMSDHVLRAAEKWGRERPGLIWCDFEAFGAELARRTGWVYYYGQENPENAPNDRTIILSGKANSEGKNLQYKWSRNLYVDVPQTAREFEQRTGRTHRRGQPADVVEVDYYLTCAESLVALFTICQRARSMLGARQKILVADRIDAKPGSGWAWEK